MDITQYACSKEIFDQDLEFSKKMHQIALPHYKTKWGTLNITTTDGNELDRRFSIDVIGEGLNQLSIYLQEKFLRHNENFKPTLTIEYMSNEEFNIKGAFFKMNIDYYIMGRATEEETDFEYLWILKWNQLKNWLSNHFTEDGLKKFLRYNYKHGRSSFLAIPSELIPKDIFIYDYDLKNTLFGFNGGSL